LPAKSPSPVEIFIFGLLLSRNLGLNYPQEIQWASLLMAMGLSPASLLLVSDLARRDAAGQPAAEAAAAEAARQAAEARRSAELLAARLDELDRRAREDTDRLRLGLAVLLQAIRELPNTPPPQPPAGG
jgi:hypothetical protein